MKTSTWFAVALAACACAPLIAQQVDATAQQNASASVAGSHVNNSAAASAQASGPARSGSVSGSAQSSASSGMRGVSASSASSAGSAASVEPMSSVPAQLVGKLDSKTARVGDRVVAKTTKTVRTADGTVIPKGTRLIGQVTAVQAHSKANADSALSIAFDRAELKNGESLDIRSQLRSVSPSAAAIEAASMQSDDMFAGGGGMGGPAFGGSAMGGGRMLGGVRAGGEGLVGGSLHDTSYAAGGLRSTAGDLGAATGETARATDHLSGEAAGHLSGDATAMGRNVRATGGLAGEGAARAMAYPTGIRGVMLSGDASGRTAGMLTADHQNIHLDSGTQMDLGIAHMN